MFSEFNIDFNYFTFDILKNNFSIYYWNIIVPLIITVLIITLYFEHYKRKQILYNIQNDIFILKTNINNSIKEIKTDVNKLNKQIEIDAKFNIHQLNIIESKIERIKNNKIETIHIIDNNIKETKKITNSLIERFEECFNKFDTKIESLKEISSTQNKRIDSINTNFDKINKNFNEIENQCSSHSSNTQINSQKINDIEETIKELIFRTNVIASGFNVGFGTCTNAFRYYRNAYKGPLLDKMYDYLREEIKNASNINYNMGEINDPYHTLSFAPSF
jgi:DNA repair exonuclease SbcCD ATPase subunit